MLSSLPKLADKAFIIGFVLPTSLFVIALLATLFVRISRARDYECARKW